MDREILCLSLHGSAGGQQEEDSNHAKLKTVRDAESHFPLPTQSYPSLQIHVELITNMDAGNPLQRHSDIDINIAVDGVPRRLATAVVNLVQCRVFYSFGGLGDGGVASTIFANRVIRNAPRVIGPPLTPGQ